MRQRISKREALKCSMVAFRTLMLNVCVTHLQKVKEYQKNGKFDLKLFDDQMEFLSAWKNKSQLFKRTNAQLYRRYATTFNYAFKYDSKLIDKLMCGYVGDDGRFHRTSVKEVVKELCDEGFLDATKLMKRGAKFRKGEDGEYSKEYDWTNKYFLANRKQWYSMLKMEAYKSWNTYPKDNHDDVYETYKNRAIRIISAYYAQFRKDAKEEAKPVEQVVKGWREVVGKLWAKNLDDIIHEIETGRGGWEALENAKKTLKLNAKISDEIDKEAYRRAREWKAKATMQMVKAEPTPAPKETNHEELKKIARETEARLLRGEISEAQATHIWRTIGVKDNTIAWELKRVRDELEKRALVKLNEDAQRPAKKPEPKTFNELSDKERDVIIDDLVKMVS